jgi:flavoprotein
VKGLGGCLGTLFYRTSVERSRACVCMSGIDAVPIPALCGMNVMAGLLKCKVCGKSREVVVVSGYLPYDS